MPPSLGSTAEASAWARMAGISLPVILPELPRNGRPARAAHLSTTRPARVRLPAEAEEAKQRQHQHDDQNDPQDAHRNPLSRPFLSMPTPGRAFRYGGGQRRQLKSEAKAAFLAGSRPRRSLVGGATAVRPSRLRLRLPTRRRRSARPAIPRWFVGR